MKPQATTRELWDDVVIIRGKGGQSGAEAHRLCVMECASWIAGDPIITDHPPCADRSLTNVAFALDDGNWWRDDAERTAALKKYAYAVVGTRNPALEKARGAVARRYAVTVFAPMRIKARANILERKYPQHANVSAKLREAAKTLRECDSEKLLPTAEGVRLSTRKLSDELYKSAADAVGAYAYAYAAAAAYADAAAVGAAAAADARVTNSDALIRMFDEMLAVKEAA